MRSRRILRGAKTWLGDRKPAIDPMGGMLMSKTSFTTAILQWLSASSVVLAGLLIGKGAAHGMSTAQWGYACLILSAAILFASLVWSPDPQAQSDQEDI